MQTCGAIGQHKRRRLVQNSKPSGTTRANSYPPHKLVRTRHEFMQEKILTECNAVLVIGVYTPNCSDKISEHHRAGPEVSTLQCITSMIEDKTFRMPPCEYCCHVPTHARVLYTGRFGHTPLKVRHSRRSRRIRFSMTTSCRL